MIFHEVLPHQDHDDHRRHLVWVLIGNQLMRCSVHSVRPVTATEQLAYELNNKDDPTQWRSIADILPARDYEDLTDQVPGEEESEEPDLPQQPDSPTTRFIPRTRVTGKSPLLPENAETAEERQQRLSADPEPAPQAVNEYEDDDGVGKVVNDDLDDYWPESPLPDDSPPYEQPEKKQKTEEASMLSFVAAVSDDGVRRNPTEHNMNWLHAAIAEEDHQWNLFQTIIHSENDMMAIEIEVDFNHNRSKKDFINNPTAFLVKKLRDSEVVFGRLSNHHKDLFTRAKSKEVNSFLQNQAVRKCLDDREVQEALGSGRILRARWVLTWKLIPPEDRQEAVQDAKSNKATVHTTDGLKKAKARIVLLGYEHPELGSSDYKTSSPGQSVIARNLLYQNVCQHDWSLEGLDLATAFLQTAPTSADARIWTSGVAELREALKLALKASCAFSAISMDPQPLLEVYGLTFTEPYVNLVASLQWVSDASDYGPVNMKKMMKDNQLSSA